MTLIKERGIEALDERQNDRGGRDSNVRRRNRMGAWYHILRHRNSGAWEGGVGGVPEQLPRFSFDILKFIQS